MAENFSLEEENSANEKSELVVATVEPLFSFIKQRYEEYDKRLRALEGKPPFTDKTAHEQMLAQLASSLDDELTKRLKDLEVKLSSIDETHKKLIKDQILCELSSLSRQNEQFEKRLKDLELKQQSTVETRENVANLDTSLKQRVENLEKQLNAKQVSKVSDDHEEDEKVDSSLADIKDRLQSLEKGRGTRENASKSLADFLEQVRSLADSVAPEYRSRRASSSASDIPRKRTLSSGRGTLSHTSSIPEEPADQEESPSSKTEETSLSKDQFLKILWSFEDLLLALNEAGANLI